MIRRSSIVLVVALAPAWCAPIGGDTLAITTVDDNTLIEDSAGAWSNAIGINFFAGRVGTNGEGKLRRGVIKFDIASIPAGSTIQSVTLKLYCSKAGTTTSFPIALKRLTAAFGEGTSQGFGGAGAPSSPGDATWLHRYYPNVFWTTPGGDFVTIASATKNVAGVGFYTWTSTAALVADVQGWVNDASSNNGWLVQGNETVLHSVKRFDSHEQTGSFKPLLTVVYTPPVFGDLDGDTRVNGADLAVLLGQWGGTGSANLDNAGVVDAADLALLLGAWTG